MQPISVIGLGAMGSALAQTLLRRGYPVTVWNRSVEKAEPLIKNGASPANSYSDAISASPATIVCIKSHSETKKLLSEEPGVLSGKTIIELSTGGASDAEELVAFMQEHGAAYLIGMINAYPTEIGDEETTIITVGSEGAWGEYESVIKALGGKSTCVGEQPAKLATLFAALATTRLGFMFGMIYGAVVCQKAGISLDDFVDQIPVSIKAIHKYYDLFATTVPSENYSDPPASMAIYAAGIDDVLRTYKNLGARSELPQLMHDLVHHGVEAGHADEQLTALVSVLSNS